MAIANTTERNNAPAPAEKEAQAPAAPQEQSTTGQAGTPDAPKKDAKKSPIPLVIGAVVLLGGAVYGFNFWQFSKTHVSSDNAYLTGNLVNISPRRGGTVQYLGVTEGDTVKRGQLIARLEDSAEQAALNQAQAADRAAATQIPQAVSNYNFQRETTAAAIARAEAGITTQGVRTTGAGTQVNLTAATVRSQIAQAQSQIAQATAQAAQVASNAQTARSQIVAAQQAVVTANDAVGALKARIASAEADVKKANKDEERYTSLVKQGAVTQSQADVAVASAQAARSALAALKQQVSGAQSQVKGAKANVESARSAFVAAQKAAQASEAQVRVAEAGLGLAKANQLSVSVQQSNLNANDAQNKSARADLQTAQAGNSQIALRRQQITSAKAELARADAALATAKVSLRDTKLYAPTNGTVVRKGVNVGASVGAGQTILSMTEGDKLWVTANLKETQLSAVRIGQPVEVDVDSFDGKKFKGIVASVNAATGASVSLLPPDNATGNFTKVVQRIPVKIALVPVSGDSKYADENDFKRLRQGMSSVVTIDTADKQAHPDRVPANFDRLPGNGEAAMATAGR